MGETVIGNFMLGTIQNGSFVPIGKFDSIETFEDDTKDQNDDYNTRFYLRGSNVYGVSCDISGRSRKISEKLFVYGWKNKMPFRKRLLKSEYSKRFIAYIMGVLE